MKFLNLSLWNGQFLQGSLLVQKLSAVFKKPVIVQVKDHGPHLTPDCSSTNYSRLRGNKRQVAMLLAYRGDNYFGIEHQGATGPPTVEAALFTALQRSGATSAAEDAQVWRRRQLRPRYYTRASRTDRGVSALGQVVSLRMRVCDNVEDAINAELPDDIRVVQVHRVPPTFNARTLCDDRLYSYTIPTFAFTPITQSVREDYRIPQERLSWVQALFDRFVGTRSFHSYSPGGDFTSDRMMRRITDVTVSPPYMAEGLQFTTIWIRGMSFVLNQIRRMVGMVVSVCRDSATVESLIASLGPQRIIAPTAPPIGLVLRRARFDTCTASSWNKHGALPWSGGGEAIVTGDGYTPHFAEAHPRCRKLHAALMHHIHVTEARDKVTLQFLSRLLQHRIGYVSTPSGRSPLWYAATMADRDLEPRASAALPVAMGGDEVERLVEEQQSHQHAFQSRREERGAHQNPVGQCQCASKSFSVPQAQASAELDRYTSNDVSDRTLHMVNAGSDTCVE